MPVPPPIDLRLATAENPYRRHRLTEIFWMLTEVIVLRNPLIYGTWARRLALRAFGAKVGRGLVAPWPFRVFMPWNLIIGEHCWIGDGVRIHNQAPLVIGNHTVISQESFISCGSHDFRRTMDLVLKPVRIGSGVWITSRGFVQPGTIVHDGVMTLPGAVVRGELESGQIYGGNPAKKVRPRFEDD